MNIQHFSQTVETLWPGKFSDQQLAAILRQIGRLDVTSEQVTAVCEAVFTEPTGKRSLQERLTERLRDASNPLRTVRAGTEASEQTFPQFIRAQWKCDGTDEEMVIRWHEVLRDKARRVYGDVPAIPHMRDAFMDLRRWVCETDEHVEALMADLYGEAGVAYCQRDRAARVYSRQIRERINAGESLDKIAKGLVVQEAGR